MESDDDKTLLTDWFVRDDNIVPPVYQLSPIREKLPDYANDEDPELKKKVMGLIWLILFVYFLSHLWNHGMDFWQWGIDGVRNRASI